MDTAEVAFLGASVIIGRFRCCSVSTRVPEERNLCKHQQPSSTMRLNINKATTAINIITIHCSLVLRLLTVPTQVQLSSLHRHSRLLERTRDRLHWPGPKSVGNRSNNEARISTNTKPPKTYSNPQFQALERSRISRIRISIWL
jgi:hypothetical protein